MIKLDILHIVPYYYPETGGAEIYSYELTKNQAKKNKVHVLTIRKGNWKKEEIIEGVNVHRVDFLKIPNLKQLFFIKSAIKKGLELIKENNIDIIHANLDYPSAIIAASLKKKTNTPYVLTVQGTSTFKYTNLPLIKQLVIHALKTCDFGFPISNALLEKLKELGLSAEKQKVIPSGVNLNYYKKLKQSVKKNKDKFKILCIARWEEVKGVEYLIRAMPYIVNKFKNIQLQLVGYGSQERYLKDLAHELHVDNSINFIGPVSYDKIPSYICSSDIFVLPSVSEGLGIVLLEAMAGELPIVASDVGGIPDLVKDGKNGFLIPSKNPKALVEKINILIRNKTLSQNMGKKGKQFLIKHKLTWNNTFERIMEVYSKLYKGEI